MRLIYSASERVYALPYGEALFRWVNVAARLARVGVVGMVTLVAAGGGTTVELAVGSLGFRDEVEVVVVAVIV